jgi:allantoinase
MPAPDLALASSRVVTSDGERPGVVLVVQGRIVDVVPPEQAPEGTEDLGDLVVMPGLVDSHVHVNDPGRAHWEGFDSATRAAAVGGITTLVDMPLNSLPPTTTTEALAAKVAAATGRTHVDVAFWGGVVPGSEDHLGALADAGVLGFKAFLCDSGVPEYGSFAPATVRGLLARTAAVSLPLIVHAEDPAALRAPDLGADPRRYATWLDTRPPEAETAAIAALLAGVRATGARVHVLHLSAAGGAELLAAARRDGLPVTVETCPHYLTLSAEAIPDGATDHKCAPPIRDRANQAALWAALRAGTIDAVVSDHSPAPPEDKGLASGDMLAAWGGIASLQVGLAVVWTAARAHGASLSDLAGWMARGPARIAGLRRKGELRAGADADVIVLDPDASWTIDPERLHHRHPISPYGGRSVQGVVRRTYLGGQLIVRDGELVTPGVGRLRWRNDL